MMMEIERIGKIIVHSAYLVHSALGPGLLESVYQTCLGYELRKSGLEIAPEVLIPIRYRELNIDAGYRIDLLVNDSVIIENKAVEKILPVHEAQLLTYMKLKGCGLGYLINWNVPVIKDGIKRMVYNLA
jgi:GxxExxY protein